LTGADLQVVGTYSNSARPLVMTRLAGIKTTYNSGILRIRDSEDFASNRQVLPAYA